MKTCNTPYCNSRICDEETGLCWDCLARQNPTKVKHPCAYCPFPVRMKCLQDSDSACGSLFLSLEEHIDGIYPQYNSHVLAYQVNEWLKPFENSTVKSPF